MDAQIRCVNLDGYCTDLQDGTMKQAIRSFRDSGANHQWHTLNASSANAANLFLML
jgi:hypothetical protein